MASKKTVASKRSALPRISDYSKAFKKDWERLSGSGRYDMRRLKAVMILLIARDEPLGPEWKDHPLVGDGSDHRECHIGGGFLLIYRADKTDIVFVRAGTHAELFE